MDKTTNGHDRKRAVLYARVSTPRQVEEGYGLDYQLDDLRAWASRLGYEVIEEVREPGISRESWERPGLNRVRELAEAGQIDAVLAWRRDRYFGEPVYRGLFQKEMEACGVKLRAMDDSPEGEFADGIKDLLAKLELRKTTDRTRAGKRQKAKQGKVLPSRQPPYGFDYAAGRYAVNEAGMAHVRRMFEMVGVEGKSLAAVKRSFEHDGVPTTHDRPYWHPTTIRRMIENDVYLARSYEEVKALVSPEAAATLDPNKRYGIYWFNRQRTRKVNGRHVREDNDPSEWIAVPTPDPSIPPGWVEAARERIKNNVRPPDAGHRFWELKGLLFCPCGRMMTTHTVRHTYKGRHYFNFYYLCSHRKRHGPRACEHAKYHNAPKVEERVRKVVLDLVRRPEVIREQVEKEIERERERLKSPERQRAGWIEEISKIGRKRDAYVEMRADGDITKEEFRQKVAVLDARKVTAERELATLDHVTERVKFLDTLPDLIEEYIRELPYLTHGLPVHVRPYTEVAVEPDSEEGFVFEEISPELFRERSPEEIEEEIRQKERERSERYRGLYETLGLKVTAHKDGTLDISIGSIELGSVSPGEEPTAVWESVTGEGFEERLDEHFRYPESRSSRRTRSPPSSRL